MRSMVSLGLAAALLVAPISVQAQDAGSPEKSPVVAQGSLDVCPAKADISLVEKDMERLVVEMNSLTETMADPAQKDSAGKIQEHIGSILHRVTDMRKKMEGEGTGVMASFKDDLAAPDSRKKAK